MKSCFLSVIAKLLSNRSSLTRRYVISKLVAETKRINAEARWFPFAMTAVVYAVAFLIVRLL